MTRKAYPSDLTDPQWALIEPILPPEKPRGAPRQVDLREVVNTILYISRTGCQWRYLPHDFPPHADVWEHFCRWRDAGLIEVVHDALRTQVREKEGREPTPSAAIIDTQSVKTPQKGGPTATMPARTSKGASATSR